MNKYISILGLTTALLFCGSGIANATCTREGKITRLTVTSGGNWVNVIEIPSGIAGWWTVPSTYLPALGAAYAANQKASVTGNAASCGAVSGGFSYGGTVTGVDILDSH